VTVGFEMHPGMVVYNPETFMRLRTAVGDVAGCNFDPSHLFWQGIDVIEAAKEIARAGALVHVHAKDTALDAANVARNGVLDTKPGRPDVDGRRAVQGGAPAGPGAPQGPARGRLIDNEHQHRSDSR
jgi:sugar phosphate isomerase/epimerase